MKAAGGDIAFLLCNCTTLGFHNVLDDLVVQISSEAACRCETHHNPAHLFDDVYMPLLQIILAILQEKGIKVEGSPFQQLFRRILSLYIVECVGKEPAAQLNWARTPVYCDCPHCHSLNEFLLSPTEISRQFERIPEVFEHNSNVATFWSRYDCEGDEKSSPEQSRRPRKITKGTTRDGRKVTVQLGSTWQSFNRGISETFSTICMEAS